MLANRGLWAGLVVVVLWASAFPAIQVAAPALGVVGLSLVRLLVASAGLLAFGLVRRSLRLPRAKDLGWIFAAGFFGMTAYQLLLNASELSVPAGTASIIVAAAPMVSVGVARLLFGERVSIATVVGSLIAIGGVVLVCLARAGVSLSNAVWIAVAAMVVQGIYHPLQRPLLGRYSSLEVASYTMLAGTLMSLPFLPLVGDWSAPTEAWLGAIYLGLAPSALGFVLWAAAGRQLPIAVATSLLYLVPPVAVLIAWLWLGEAPLTSELLGGLVVLSGVLTIHQGPRLLAAIKRRVDRRARTGGDPPPTQAAELRPFGDEPPAALLRPPTRPTPTRATARPALR